MPVFDVQDLADWTGGTWTRRPDAAVRRVVHDSREAGEGALFVALKGERFDGHEFLAGVLAAGAAGVVCGRGRGVPGAACLEVEDPQRALEDMARGHRRTLGGRVVGITGSAGKTTAKDLLAAMLGQRGRTCRTRGNWNNQIGLPLSLLGMEREDAFGVFEAGMNHAGEIGHLCGILEPEAGLITSIGEAHLEALGSVDAIAAEKISLLSALPTAGLAVVDLDNAYRGWMLERTRARVVTCSMRGEADYRGEAVGGGMDGVRIADRVRGEVLELALPLPGEHMMRNVVQTVAVAREFGLTGEEIAAGLAGFSPAPMRWERMEAGPWAVINDAYNANPLSMRSSIQAFAGLREPGVKWLVLGGMNELGAEEARAHVALGEWISGRGLAGVVTVGAKARGIFKGCAGLERVHAADKAEAVRVIGERVPAGAGLLVKASRGDRLEEVISMLQAQFKEKE